MVICLLKIIISHYTFDFFFVVVITLYIITRDTPKINILQTQENYYDAHTKHHNMQNFMCKHPFFLKQFPCTCLILNHLLMFLIQSLSGISYKMALKLIIGSQNRYKNITVILKLERKIFNLSFLRCLILSLIMGNIKH